MKKFATQFGWKVGVLIVVIVAAYAYWTTLRPLPKLKPPKSLTSISSPVTSSSIAWPGVGQSAVGIVGSSILQTHGTQTPAPTASTAKLVTALTILKEKPLSVGEQGPTITLSANDVAIYNSYVAQDGSVVKVTAGEQISEYQMLEGMLLPSANNMADSLAIWAFGSLPAYSSYANTYAAGLGLTHTAIGSDASGFNPSTTSTAGDLVKLGEMVMQNPVLAGIVDQPSVSGFPVVGSIKNINFLLGNSNIVGIKTGNSDQAGGVYISASKVVINAQPVTIVTSLLSAPTLVDSLDDSLPMIKSAQSNFKPVTVVKAGQVVGSYKLPWGGDDAVVATSNLVANVWGGNKATATLNLQPVAASTVAGSIVGSTETSNASFGNPSTVTVTLSANPSKPSLWWRISHPKF